MGADHPPFVWDSYANVTQIDATPDELARAALAPLKVVQDYGAWMSRYMARMLVLAFALGVVFAVLFMLAIF